MRSKHWQKMVEILDKNFPKGECSERGAALVMLAEIEMLVKQAAKEVGERYGRAIKRLGEK